MAKKGDKAKPDKKQKNDKPEKVEEPEELEECDLTCVPRGPVQKVHEFIGPVKLVFVTPNPMVYCRQVWLAGLMTFVNILIGGTMAQMMFFGIKYIKEDQFDECTSKPPWKVLHIFLCYFGYQVFMPVAILCIDPKYGPSAPLKPMQRKNAHLTNQITAIVFAVSGTGFVIYNNLPPDGFILSIHNIAGYAAGAFMLISIITGPFSYITAKRCGVCWNILKGLHIFFGVPAFVASTVCFVTGMLKDEISPYYKKPYGLIPLFLCVFSIIITLIVCINPLVKMFSCKFKYP